MSRPASITVVRPGLLTTVQDLGRWGHQDMGVPVAGPMDTQSHRLANAMVGNDVSAATLEVTLTGPELRAEGDVTLAMVGADFDLFVDDAPADRHAPILLHAGACVRCGGRRRGARAYVAVAGGVVTALVLGSRATHLVSRMGGVDGRAVMAGDVLPVGVAANAPVRRSVAAPAWLPGAGPTTLRVMLGPQEEWFSAHTLDAFVTGPFTVTTQSNRMGFRLRGPVVSASRGGEMLSEPVPFGAIQVPAGGEPILLMADRQTAGGYPKIATVISADLPVAGQLSPGDIVRFQPVTRPEAMAALIVREREFLRVAGEAGAW